MRVDETPDRLEIELTMVAGGCAAVAFLFVAAPAVIALTIWIRSAGELLALVPAASCLALLALAWLLRRHTSARVVLDRLANEARIERTGLAPDGGDGDGEAAGAGVSRRAAITTLEAIVGAEVLESKGSEGDTFYKPALRIRGRKPLAITSYGSGTRGESDEVVRRIVEWLGRGRAS